MTAKPNRLGLYLPFILLLVAIVAWTVFWIWARGEARARMDAAVAGLRRAGYEVSWKDRNLGGYPFRMDVTLTDARLRDPSGWTLATPRLEAEAYMHALGHWVLAAPDGLAFVRPVGGPVAVSGRIIRASLADFDKRPLSFSFEGLGLTFRPDPGAQPFALAGAERVEFHLRAGPDDEGGVFAKVEGGKAQPGGLFARIAGDRPIAIAWNSTLSKMSALAGPDWPAAVRNWSNAGGVMHVREAGLTAGDAVAGTKDATLRVGSDGRVGGTLDTTLRRAPQVLAALAASGVIAPDSAAVATAVVAARQGTNATAQVAITFQAGQTTLGPVAVGPAPKVYEVR